MKKLLLALTIFIGTNTYAAASNNWQISANAFGPISIGMNITAAEQASGKTIVVPAAVSDDTNTECQYATFKNGPTKVKFMLNHNTIVRIDIKNPLFKTETGVHVGTSVDRTLFLYVHDIEVQPDKYAYDKGWQNLTVKSKNADQNQLIFDTDGKKVINIRLGRLPEVAYVEGCG